MISLFNFFLQKTLINWHIKRFSFIANHITMNQMLVSVSWCMTHGLIDDKITVHEIFHYTLFILQISVRN